MSKLTSLSGAAVLAACLGVASPALAQITGKQTEKTEKPFVERSLVVPEMTVMGELDASFTHMELGDGDFSLTLNGGFIDLWGKLGVLDDLEVELVVLSLLTEEGGLMPTSIDAENDADWGLFRAGATLRLLATDPAELGLRFRLLVDNNAVVGLNGGVPVLVRGGDVVRLDTGVAWVGRVNQTASLFGVGSDASFGLVDVNTLPMGPEPGIPLRLSIQAIEELWIGLNTGFGAWDVTEDDSIFLPLGASIGGTIDAEPLLLDILGSFNFPLFIAPAGDDTDAIIQSEIWQVGLGARGYFALPK